MKKRVFSILLCLCLVVGLLPTAALANESPVSNWADAVTTAPEGYTESDSTVTISTAEGLAWFAKQVNTGVDYSEKTVELSADIDLSGKLWTPIGSAAYCFVGVFDGGEHTVSGLNVDITTNGAGLFGVVGGGTTIKNLEVSGSVKTSGKYAGGIVGNSTGTGLVTIENCTNHAAVTSDGANAAGLIGCCDGSNATFVIKNCCNTGTISGGKESAAISGWLGNNATVENCWNMGSITGADSGKTFARFGNTPAFTNCYQLKSVGMQSDITVIQSEDISSGALAFMLGAPWGQHLDGEGTPDARPVLNGPVIYAGYSETSCKRVYSNSSAGLSQNRPDHDEDYDNYYIGRCGTCGDPNPNSAVSSGMDLTSMEAVNTQTWSWNPDTKTLSLRDFQMTMLSETPVKLPHGATIELYGSNTLVATDITTATGIEAAGSLTIRGMDGDASLTMSISAGTAISCVNDTEAVTLEIDNVSVNMARFPIVVRGGTNQDTSFIVTDSDLYSGKMTIESKDASKDSTDTVKFSVTNSTVDSQCSGANVNTVMLTGHALDVDIHNSNVKLWNSGYGFNYGHAYAMRLNGKSTSTINFSDSNLTFYSMDAGLWSDTFSDDGYNGSSIENCTIVTYSKAEAALCFMDNDTDANNYGNDNVTAEVLNSYVDDCILLQCSSMEQTGKTVEAAIMGSPVIKQDFALAKELGSVTDLSEYIAEGDGFTLQSGQSITVAEGVEVTLDEVFVVTVEEGASIAGQFDANIVPQGNAGVVLHDGELTNIVSANAEGIVQRPADPERECFALAGWYTDENFETEYTFPREVSGTEHAYAKWIVAHRWDNGEITTPATCLTAGVRTYTCQNNSAHTKTEDIAIDADTHSFSADWTYDSTNHWHEPTCGHDVIADEATHNFGIDGSCDTCGYTKQPSVSYPVYEPTYPPSIEKNEGGETTVSNKYPEKGDTVTVTTKPETGYVVGEVTITDIKGNEVEVVDNGDGTYSFKQPAGKVNIEVTYVPAGAKFTDVAEDAYYYDAVNWAVAEGISDGTSATTFSPNAPCTRAQMVTFLWRAAGCPEPTTKGCPFNDVDMDSYYGKAVLWAVENGITNGTSDTTFSPDMECSRAQMAAFLCRMADGEAVSDENTFVDVEDDAYYAESVQWAVENGITEGTGDNKYSPDAVCTRGQMVVFLYRYYVK